MVRTVSITDPGEQESEFYIRGIVLTDKKDYAGSGIRVATFRGIRGFRTTKQLSEDRRGQKRILL